MPFNDEFDENLEATDSGDEFNIHKESEQAGLNEFYGTPYKPGEERGVKKGLTELWLVSYSDFMTILLIFFLSMYGYTYLSRASLERKLKQQYAQFSEVVNQMKDRLGDDVKIENDLEKITIQLRNNVLFDSGDYKLSPGAQSTLAELANSLKLINGQIIVEGHTDNVPITGGRLASNWELSVARAFSVIDALTAQGIEAKRLTAWGFGENRPLESNEFETGRKQNRRIEIVVMKETPNSEG